MVAALVLLHGLSRGLVQNKDGSGWLCSEADGSLCQGLKLKKVSQASIIRQFGGKRMFFFSPVSLEYNWLGETSCCWLARTDYTTIEA